MRVGFGEKFARASRHVRGAWQTKAEQRQKVSQRNQHFLAKRRSLLLSSVEPSTSARTKARVHASHGGPSRGIATPGRARSEREPTAFGCRARARPACFERPRRRPRPRSPRVGSFATRRVPSPSPRHPPRPTPRVSTRPSRRRTPLPPRTSPPRSGACTRTSRGTCPPAATSRPRACTCGARSPRRRRASARTTRTSPPRATTLPSCTACRGGSTRPRSCTRSRRPRWRSTTGPRTPPRARRCTTWRGAS